MDALPLNPVDLAVVAILLVSGVVAFFRGFVREVLAVGVWVGAAFVTLYAFKPAQPYARQYISTTLLADAVTGAAIFILALIALTLVSNALAKRVQASQMGALDRSLGFVFGLGRGLVIAAIVFLIASWLMPSPEQPDWMKTARTTPLLRASGDFILGLLPEDAERRSREAVGSAADNARDAADRARALQRVTAPPSGAASPAAPAGPATPAPADSRPDSGYKDQERRALDGLIRGNQDKRP